jgi:hypothetical protein
MKCATTPPTEPPTVDFPALASPEEVKPSDNPRLRLRPPFLFLLLRPRADIKLCPSLIPLRERLRFLPDDLRLRAICFLFSE